MYLTLWRAKFCLHLQFCALTWPMQPLRIRSLAVAGLFLATTITLQIAAPARAQAPSVAGVVRLSALHTTRTLPSDLELSGEITALPPGATRYITRDDLLALPQVSYTITDDANFTGSTQVSGVLLEELIRDLGAEPASDMVIAICDDQYRAHYPRAYIAGHHPLLVLKINGQSPAGWPKSPESHHDDMGPFLISHPKFAPSPNIFSHRDEAQIPWGVVRLEFRNEKTVFSAIAPRGLHATDSLVQAGYRIAQQNCFRCHNMGREGGTKAGHPWLVLSAWATTSPEYFGAYVRNPQAKNPQAQMPGNPSYDDETLGALTAYFQIFSSSPPEEP
jgi:mono/diheme cytochrome c family protein